MDNKVEQCERIADQMRKTIVEVAEHTNQSMHWGGSLSCIEILATLYGAVLNTSNLKLDQMQRDKFLLSKGHAAIALYSVMAETGIISKEELQNYQKNGSDYPEISAANERMGIEVSGGSLGIGPSYGVGLALSAKRKQYPYKTVVLVGDGEIDEGSVWEAVMSASQFALDNLTMIIDANGLQSDGETTKIMSWKDLYQRLECFGWDVFEVDGHDCKALYEVMQHMDERNRKPKAIIANTVKGRGISFCENDYEWHDKVMSKAELEQAKKEVGLL
ncbi:transketolase, N-terminal section [Lachnospiraceae bacterium KM106-2]|nr:transketolase, N-terminal section [Lachnospiraceae bacterium KM106-2]